MLFFFGLTRKFINFAQSGMYLDYIIKKCVEPCIRNILVYGAIFFGEKFMIEFLSRKAFDRITLRITDDFINKSYDPALTYRNIAIGIVLMLFALEIYVFFIL